VYVFKEMYISLCVYLYICIYNISSVVRLIHMQAEVRRV